VTKRKRRNIFIGTTNDAQPLSDPSGNRRFLPVRVAQSIDLEGFAADIRQLIGEAAAMQTKGDKFELPPEMYEKMGQHQETARQASDLEVLFADWFGGDTAAFVTKADLIRLCDATGRKNASQVVHAIMERIGFEENAVSNFNGKPKVKVWFRSAAPMLPKHITNLPQYQVDTSQHSPRVVLRSVQGVIARRRCRR
jgi:predicted P-loop ATPase